MLLDHLPRRGAMTALATLLTLVTAASADARVLASGFLLSSNASRVGCRVLNVGSTAVTITSADVVTDAGQPVTDFDSCTGTLAAGKSCTVTAPGNMLAGIVRVNGPTKNLRGVCLLMAPGNNVLESTEMR